MGTRSRGLALFEARELGRVPLTLIQVKPASAQVYGERNFPKSLLLKKRL
jgi:hypothetical protein